MSNQGGGNEFMDGLLHMNCRGRKKKHAQGWHDPQIWHQVTLGLFQLFLWLEVWLTCWDHLDNLTWTVLCHRWYFRHCWHYIVSWSLCVALSLFIYDGHRAHHSDIWVKWPVICQIPGLRIQPFTLALNFLKLWTTTKICSDIWTAWFFRWKSREESEGWETSDGLDLFSK